MISRSESGSIKIATASTLAEYEAAKSQIADCHLILIDEWQASLIKYPTKISFQLSTPENIDDYLATFPSSKRSSIRKRIDSVSEKFNIRIIESLSKDDFNDWMSGYEKFIGNLEFGRKVVTDDWFETKAPEHIGIFFYHESHLAGGMLVKKFAGKLSMSYAWYNDDLRKEGGSTAALFALIEYANEKAVPAITFGQDTNLFGGHLSLGLHEFKVAWSTKPTLTKASVIKGLVVSSTNPLPGKIIFYALNEQDQLYKVEIDGESTAQ